MRARRERPRRFAGAVGLLVVGFGIALLASAPGVAQVKVPPDFTFKQADSSPGEVTCSHANHNGQTTIGNVVVFSIDDGDKCHK